MNYEEFKDKVVEDVRRKLETRTGQTSFKKSYTPKQMEDTIIKLLEQWQKKRDRDMSL